MIQKLKQIRVGIFITFLTLVWVKIAFDEPITKTVIVYKDSIRYIHPKKKPTGFNSEKLIAYMKSINIKFPEVVYQQAKLESGNFKSNLFTVKNNMFGMKKAMQRTTLSIGRAGDYAYFKSWKECVIDYGLYQSRYFADAKNAKEYIEMICESYAQDKDYKQLLFELCGIK